MSPKSTLNPSRALQGMHGVHVVSSSRFESEETTQNDLSHSTYGTSPIGANQQLFMQRVWQQRPPCLKLIQGCCIQGLMEVAFAKRALKDPELRMAHNVHKMSSLLGGVLFIADDMFPQTPFLHAAWHLAAAVGVGTCNKLLE